MKKVIYVILLVFYFLGIVISVFSQTVSEIEHNDSVYLTLKSDTIEADFVVELLSFDRFYSQNDVILQNNLIFINNRVFTNNPASLYQGDSVFIVFGDLGKKYFKGKNKIDYESLGKFYSAIEEFQVKDKKGFRKSRVKITADLVFLKIHARLVVLNVKEQVWKIPKIFAEKCHEKFKFYHCCEKPFKNTFLLSKVLSFNTNTDTYSKNNEIKTS